MEQGYTDNLTVPANSYLEQTITFAESFSASNAYSATTTLLSGRTDTTGLGYVSAIVRTRAASSMVIRVVNDSSSSQVCRVIWLAIE